MLDFGKALRERIEKAGKYRVVMTRSDDTFVPLAETGSKSRATRLRPCSSRSTLTRCPRARAMHRGATIYTLSDKASDAEAAALAETENKADAIARHQPD